MSSRRFVFGVGAFGLVCITASCSLFTSLSGFSSGDEASDASVDAGLDADAGDALRPDAAEAGADGAEASLDAGPFCARVDASFCEDFDDPTAASRWTLSSVAKATHGIDTAAFTSAPASLFGRTTPLAAGQAAESFRTITFSQRSAALAFALDIRVDQRGQRGLVVATGALDDSAANATALYRVSVVLGEGSDYVEESREAETIQFASHPLTTRIPDGKWARVSVGIVRASSGVYRVLVTVDGQPALDEVLGLWTT